MADVAAPPLRVGLIGCGRVGMHLIEHFAAGGPFRVVAVADATPGFALTNVVAPFGVRWVQNLEELFAAEDVDVVWFTWFWGFRGDFVPAGVYYGKHTIGEAPFTLSSKVVDRTFEYVTQRDRLLLIHHPRRSDPDFLQALSVAKDQSLGCIRAAKWVSWTYGLPPRGVARGQGPLPPDGSDDAQVTKVRFVAHALDQLVLLVGDRPCRLSATSDWNASGSPDLFAGYSLSLQITFEHGCHAEIDIRLDSPTQFQSGWLLAAERGGYAKGRRFTLTDEGEVFDSPVTLSSEGTESTDQFEWLAQQIRSGMCDPAEESRVRTVVALLDAAQQSLDARQGVEV